MNNQQLARDELARRKFEHFIRLIDPAYSFCWANELIARRLQRFYEQVENGESPRLMISLQPRFGKSLTTSQYFPLWAFGNDPTLEIVVASYASNLSERFSRRVRDVVRDDDIYRRLFPHTVIAPDSQAVDSWYTTLNGNLSAVGVGSGLTGRGANILIIDDPIRDAQAADSITVREALMDWYSSVAYTRLYPGAGVIVMNTRWSVEDLSGKLLSAMDNGEDYADKWEVLTFPAIATQEEYISEDGTFLSYELKEGFHKVRDIGEALHPERYDVNALRRIKATLAPRHWAALYQQDPLPEDGAFFNLEDVRYGTPPLLDDTNVFIAADTAASTSEGANDSCIVCGAYDNGRNLWILDMVVGKLNSYAFCDALLDMYLKYPQTISVGIEHGPISLALMPLLEQRMIERGIYLPLKDQKFMRPSQSKEIRARPIQGIMQQRKVWFPSGNVNWVTKALSQMKKFPQGEADDIIDALAWLGRLVLDMGPPKGKRILNRPIKSWKTRLKNQNRGRRYLES